MHGSHLMLTRIGPDQGGQKFIQYGGLSTWPLLLILANTQRRLDASGIGQKQNLYWMGWGLF
jgi:hypothetical protein